MQNFTIRFVGSEIVITINRALIEFSEVMSKKEAIK